MVNSSGQKLSIKEIEEGYNMAVSLGKKYTDEEKFELAAKEYKEALKYRPDQIQAMGELCWCLGQIDKPEEMLEYAKKALLISQKRCSKDNIGRFYFYIAQYYKITEQYETACDYFKLSIKNKPYFLSNYIDMAYCQRMLGNFDKAIELYEQVKETDEDYAKNIGIDDLISQTTVDRDFNNREMIHIKLGVELEKKGELEKAKESFFTAVQRNPKHTMALFLLFKTELALKKDYYEIISIGESLMSLLNAEDKGFGTTFFVEMTSMGLAKCYEVIGNSEKAQEYSKLNNYTHHFNEGKKAEEKKEYEKAVEEYEKALEIENKDFRSLDALTDLLFNTRQYDEAMDCAVRGLEIAKEVNDSERIAKYKFDIGCRLEIARYDKALEFYEDAFNTAQTAKNKLRYCNKVANYYADRGETRKALDYFYKCNEYIKAGEKDIYDIQSNIIKQEELLDENSALNQMMKHYNIGAKFFNEMNYEEAAKEMMIALNYIPQDLDTMDVLNRCLYKLKKFDECYDIAYEGYLISCRDHDYRFFDMFCYNIANILYNSNRCEEALKFYRYASIHSPEDTDYLYFIGACYRNLGRYEDAITYFRKVLDINPDDQGATEQLALCMNKLGRK